MINISVIVTSYNQAETLSETLDHILSQHTQYSYEILIGDDCSTDNTKDICAKYSRAYPDVIRAFHYSKNGGVATNFVLTIREAKGEYIALCAADDYWHNPRKLQVQMDYFQAHPECGFVYTDYNKLHIGTNKISENYLQTSRTPIYEGFGLIKTVFAGQFPALTLTVMFKKELFDRYIPWEDYIHYRFTLEDWPTWLIFSKYTNIGYMAESTATYRYGHESISNPKSYEKIVSRFTNEKFMYEYLCKMFPEDIHYNEQVYDDYVTGLLLELAYKRNDFIKAKEYSLQIKGNYKSIKQKMALNFITFNAYRLIRKLK